jgi:myo-inositol-1(or 4)-monophosphatase
MDRSELARRLELVGPLAREAAALAVRIREQGGGSAKLKGPQDLVTEADGAVERFIREELQKLFSGEPVLGEEMGGVPDASGPLWILDPIDGTSNFSRGSDRWCVSIGLSFAGRAVLGLIARHTPSELFAGAEGCAATLNGVPIRPAATADVAQALVEVGWSLRLPFARFVDLANAVMAAGAGLRSSGSGTLGLVEVATGRLDAYVERHINSWDAAAALAIARAAGCWDNGFDSGEWLARGNPICISTPALGPTLAALLEG